MSTFDGPPALQFGSGTCMVWFQVDLNESTGSALPFESLGQLRTLCLSPDGLLLLAIDVEGKALLINRKRQVLLHHFSFKGPVATARFSPDGQFIACAVQRLVQVSMSLHLQKQVALRCLATCRYQPICIIRAACMQYRVKAASEHT